MLPRIRQKLKTFIIICNLVRNSVCTQVHFYEAPSTVQLATGLLSLSLFASLSSFSLLAAVTTRWERDWESSKRERERFYSGTHREQVSHSEIGPMIVYLFMWRTRQCVTSVSIVSFALFFANNSLTKQCVFVAGWVEWWGNAGQCL